MADNDGAHIADLLLLMFLKVFPGLVESGKIYKAVPPLYGIPMGKSRTQYFAERVDFVRYMQKEYYKKNKVTDLKGKPIESSVFSSLLIENSDYMYDFEAIMNRHKLSPILLEMILQYYIKNDKFESLRKKITSEYRFMENDNVLKKGNGVFIKGLVNDKIETIYADNRFKEECSILFPAYEAAMKKDKTFFLVNGAKFGLYELISDAMNSMGSVSRFKGLGEMNPDQLRASTMHPDTRTLIQYTIDDLNETMKIIRQYDSNKKLILNKIGLVDRGDLIGL